MIIPCDIRAALYGTATFVPTRGSIRVHGFASRSERTHAALIVVPDHSAEQVVEVIGARPCLTQIGHLGEAPAVRLIAVRDVAETMEMFETRISELGEHLLASCGRGEIFVEFQYGLRQHVIAVARSGPG